MPENSTGLEEQGLWDTKSDPVSVTKPPTAILTEIHEGMSTKSSFDGGNSF